MLSDWVPRFTEVVEEPTVRYLSCFPRILYHSGGYYDTCVQLEDLVSSTNQNISFCDLLGSIYPSSAYPRNVEFVLSGPDPTFLNNLREHCAAISARFATVAESIAIVLGDCFVSDSIIYRRSGIDLDVIYETQRKNDRPWASLIDTAEVPREFLSISLPGRSLLYLGSVGSGNYAHWLVDDLPRLAVLDRISGPVTVLLPSYGEKIDAVRKDSLYALVPEGRDVRVEFIGAKEPVHCGELIYVTPVSYHPVLKSPHALNFVRAAVRRRLQNQPVSKKRLFVTRQAGRYRYLTNEAEITAELESLGFETVCPEMLDFMTQASLFAQAEIVVGIMGAGMGNTIFAEPGIPTVYLAPTGWFEPFYWDLANGLGHEYSVLFGELDAADAVPYMTDFHIDPAALTRHLRNIV
jgi:hypothetical protein